MDCLKTLDTILFMLAKGTNC